MDLPIYKMLKEANFKGGDLSDFQAVPGAFETIMQLKIHHRINVSLQTELINKDLVEGTTTPETSVYCKMLNGVINEGKNPFDYV
ncbi:MAG: hypothetical protein ACRC1Z_04375 [Waterburya sp.]